jgi:outer membrane biosynthesis protein TonB
MPTLPSQIDPEKPLAEPDTEPLERDTPAPLDPEAPLSFIPHPPNGQPPAPAMRFRTNRYGELDEHELIRLLDTIEDERARGRFRESIYISVFVWLAIAGVVFYGPKYLWHAPQLISPIEVMKQRQLVELNAPVLPHHAVPPPKLDNRTLEKLRAAEPKPVRTPTAPPVEAASPVPQPQPSPAPPALPLPSAPAPVATHTPPPVVADAPTPQPTTRPNFNTPGSASDEMRNAIRDASRNRNGGSGDIRSGASAPRGATAGGGVEVLSDMQGVDFTEYLKRLHRDIMRNWIPLLPEETEAPLYKKGDTFIIVTILPDGKIGDMRLDGSSHDVAIDKASWGSILSEGQFQALPSQFHGPNLILRFHYVVNEDLR